MTVKELIAKLSELDQDKEIMYEVDMPHSESFVKPIFNIGHNNVNEDGDDYVYVIY